MILAWASPFKIIDYLFADFLHIKNITNEFIDHNNLRVDTIKSVT